MPRPNPLAFHHTTAVTRTETFIDPRHPDTKFEFTFCVDGGSSAHSLRVERGRELADKWIDKMSPKLIPLGNGGKAIVVAEEICGRIATFMQADEAANNQDAYNEMEWLVLSQEFPTVFKEVWEWWMMLWGEARGILKNVPKADAENESGSPLTTMQDTIPNTSNAPITSPA